MSRPRAIAVLVSFAVIFSAGAALAWTGPTAPPPGNNVSAPVNVGSSFQDKSGSVWFDGGVGINQGSSFCIGTSCITSWPSGGSGYWTLSGSNLYPNSTSDNVGIGTTNPRSQLEVGGSGTFRITNLIANPGWNGWILSQDSSTAHLDVSYPGGWQHIINAAWDTGKVGIGTASPIGTLDVENGANTATICLNGSCSTSIGGGGGYWTGSLTGTINNANSGNVGIGNETPSVRLDVAGGSEAIYSRNSPGGSYTFIGNTGSYGRIGAYSPTSSWQNLILAEGGNVGIGETNPYQKLEVLTPSGSATNNEWQSNGFQLWTGSTAGNQTLYMGNDPANHLSYIQAVNVGNWPDTLLLNERGGNVGIGTASPSAKLDISGGSLRVLGSTSSEFPTSGTGIELDYDTAKGVGYVTAYDRSASAFKYLLLDGTTVSIDGTSHGDVGIGTWSPNGTLDVENGANTATICLNGSCTSTPANQWGGGGTNYWTLSGSNLYNNAGTNVGIGTSNPRVALDVAGGSEGIYSSASSGGPYTFVGNTGSYGRIGAYSPTSGWQNLILAEGGNVGIGMTNPDTKLGVAGSIELNSGSSDGGRIYWDSAGYTNWTARNYNGELDFYEGEADGWPASGAVLALESNTSVHILGSAKEFNVEPVMRFHNQIVGQGNYSSDWIGTDAIWHANDFCIGTGPCLSVVSDERLKKNIQSLDASSSLAEILALNPVSFNWRDPAKATTTQLGFIAQDVQSVLPELVYTSSSTALTPGGTLNLNYQGLIAPVVGAIKELYAMVEGMAQSFTTLHLTVGSSAKPTGITLYDDATGQPYCVHMHQGQLASAAGACPQ